MEVSATGVLPEYCDARSSDYNCIIIDERGSVWLFVDYLLCIVGGW